MCGRATVRLQGRNPLRWGNVLTSRERDRVPALGDDPFLSDAEMRVKFRHPRSQDRCAPPRAAQSRPSRPPPRARESRCQMHSSVTRARPRLTRSPHPPATRSYWWRCDPTATFAECKAAADKIVSSSYPNEPYDTDCFKRDHDKLLWDGRVRRQALRRRRLGPGEGHHRAGVQGRRRDRVRPAPAQAVARDVQRPERGEGRSSQGASREARAGDADEIIAQAAKQVEDPANKYYHGKQGALVKESTGLEGLDLGFRDRRARSEGRLKVRLKVRRWGKRKVGRRGHGQVEVGGGSAGVDAKAKTMSATGKSTKSSAATSGGAKAAA